MIKYFVAGDYAPETATDGSAGLDLYVNSLDQSRTTIGTGVHVEIPNGWVGLLLPRSSWGVKGLSLANTMGVIDSDYRGEIKIVRDIHPHKGHLSINKGDKIAQLVVVRCITAAQQVDSFSDLSVTDRGEGGFGSTGGA